jgi:hypothetical protein
MHYEDSDLLCTLSTQAREGTFPIVFSLMNLHLNHWERNMMRSIV